MYLLEGLARWNENRGRAAVEGGQRPALRCFSAQLQHSFNQLTQEFLGRTLVGDYTKPTEYTGKLSELSNMTLLLPCAVCHVSQL